MPADVVAQLEPASSCCKLLKEKYAKLEEKRNALRQAVKLLEQQIDKIQTENLNLKQAYEKERERADDDREAKEKESSLRVPLEKEISSLKLEITSLQEKVQLGAQDGNGELKREKEINLLKELLEKERIRADYEKKKADEAWQFVKTEKNKAEEQRKLVDIELKKVEEKRVYYEKLHNEAESKHALETFKFEETNKRFEVEKAKRIRERNRAENLDKQLEEHRKRIEELERELCDKKLKTETKKKKVNLQSNKLKSEVDNEKFVSLLKYEEVNRLLELEKQKVITERKRADSETANAEQQRKIAEENRIKAVEETSHADQLFKQLQESRLTIEELQKKMCDQNRIAETEKLKLLKKQLKFEKMQVKHAKQVSKLEKGRNNMLNQELCRLKLDFVQFSHRLNMMDNFLTGGIEGIDGFTKTGNLKGNSSLILQPTQTYPRNDNELTKLLPTVENCTESITGIDSKTEPLIGGSNRKISQNCALNSTTASFSDRQLIGSQENHAVVAENSVKSPSYVIEIANRQNGERRKGIYDAVESIETLYSEDDKLQTQIEEKLSLLHRVLNKQISKPVTEGRCLASGRSSKKRKRIDEFESKGGEEGWIVSFEKEVVADYMKFLALDNSADEGRYLMAMERPLSPTLPEIKFQSSNAFNIDKSKSILEESFDEIVSIGKEDLAARSSFDVINVEINSNTLKTMGNYQKGFSVSIRKENASGIQSEREVGSMYDNIAKYCIAFSDMKDRCSVLRIFCSIEACVELCGLVNQKEWWVPNILYALSMEEKLLPKEKVCVIFSLLVHNLCRAALRISGNFLYRESIPCLDSFAAHMKEVISAVETGSLFLQLCPLNELLSLTEDFLIERKVLAYGGLSTEPQSATTHQLIAGGIILASLCLAVDQIGFIWEASYSIFRAHGCDSQSTLVILHVFAYLCRRDYFTLSCYSLVMTVMKSLITYFEKENFCSCVKCPFAENAASVDVIGCMLLEKFENYSIQNTMHEEMIEINSFNTCRLFSAHVGFNDSSCQFTDTLSLLELIACKMGWYWTSEKVVPKLWEILESCLVEKVSVAVIILLGQIGRLGVDATGYEDDGVKNLRSRLLGFLCHQSKTKELGFPIQIAVVSSLLRLLSPDFKDFIQGSFEMPSATGQHESINVIKEWFYSLASEQQSVSVAVFDSGGVHQKPRDS